MRHRNHPKLPGRLGNLLLPRTPETKRKISEGLRRYHAKCREALAAQEASSK